MKRGEVKFKIPSSDTNWFNLEIKTVHSKKKWFWGFPEQNKDFAITTYGGGASLIRYSSKTAEQNFMKLSGIVHYMMPYCTSYFKFLSAWFWDFPEQNKDFAIQNIGERGVSFCEHCSQYF